MLGVVVLTYNNVKALRLVLWGLVHQTTENFVVHVICDGGPHGIYEAFQKSGIWKVQKAGYSLLTPETTEIRRSAARNKGASDCITKAGGQITRFLFLDGDCIPGPRMVERHLLHLDRPVIVAGIRKRIQQKIARAMTMSDVEHLEDLAYATDDRFQTTPEWKKRRLTKVKRMMQPGVKYPELCHGFQVSYPADKFREVGGFCEELTHRNDQDLAQRVVRRGCTTLLDVEAVCYHLDHPARNDSAERAKADRIYRDRWGGR